eukprot:2012495-Ditylum_brightwellii.AAC.1
MEVLTLAIIVRGKEDCRGVKELAIKEDGEVRKNTCMEDCLEVNELAIKEDGEVGASSHLCNKPVSSQEI